MYGLEIVKMFLLGFQDLDFIACSNPIASITNMHSVIK